MKKVEDCQFTEDFTFTLSLLILFIYLFLE